MKIYLLCFTPIGEATRRQQSVRTSCDALTNIILAADTNPHPFKKHSIADAVNAMLHAAKGDEFLTTILSSFPKDAISDGVLSLAGLKTRFANVKRVCRRVSLVPEEGAGLGTYLISFCQSLLTIDMQATSYRTVKSSHQTSNFQLLEQAECYLQQGKIEAAIKLVNELEGEPRIVAKDWLKEARLYLATRQAVIVLAEYLTATSISVL